MSEKPSQDGYKTLCETCDKQIGPVRPDTKIGRARHDMDQRGHGHETETEEIQIRPVTDGGFTFEGVESDE